MAMVHIPKINPGFIVPGKKSVRSSFFLPKGENPNGRTEEEKPHLDPFFTMILLALLAAEVVVLLFLHRRAIHANRNVLRQWLLETPPPLSDRCTEALIRSDGGVPGPGQ